MFIKIFLLIIIILIISRIASKYLKKELTVKEFVLWVLFWIGAGFIVIWPDTSSYLAMLLGVGRGADLVIYLSLVLVFYLLFRIFVRIEKIERDITKIISHIALKDEDRKER